MKIIGQDCVIQLLEYCDEDLQKDLTRATGDTLTTKIEEKVLAAVKILAVREENAMVARVTLNEMQKERNKPMRSFGGRVRGQACVCKYLLDCDCDGEISYSKHILQEVVVQCLLDSAIRLDILSDTTKKHDPGRSVPVCGKERNCEETSQLQS